MKETHDPTIAGRPHPRRARNLCCALLIFALGATEWGFSAYLVTPSATDSNITQVYIGERHWVYPPDTNTRNRLLLMLPGTLARPSAYQGVMEAGAAAGLHVIGLVYVNTNDVSSRCGLDCQCYEDYRMEMIDGTDRTTNLVMDRANSIENRLNKLLLFMATNNPTEGWGQFLDSTTNAVWSNIIVAGHSQGAGHAAMLAHTRRVARVLMFSWSDRCLDFPNPVGPPPWVSTNNPTPGDRYFGFHHTNDPTVLAEWATQTWARLGLPAFGEVTMIEDAPLPPHGPTHSHFTDTAPRGTNGAAYHNATAVDLNTPTNAAGQYVYAPLWSYMMVGPTRIPDLVFTNGGSNPLTVRWEAVEDAHYYLERSTNLTAWTSIAGPITGFYGIVTTNLPPSEPAQYFRLRLPY